MRLGHAMFAGRIAGLALFGADLAATGYAAFQLGSNFVAASFFEWIRATAAEEQATNCNQDRTGPHPLILGMKLAFASG